MTRLPHSSSPTKPKRASLRPKTKGTAPPPTPPSEFDEIIDVAPDEVPVPTAAPLPLIEPSGPTTVAAWAGALLDTLPVDVTAEDRATVAAQIAALGRATTDAKAVVAARPTIVRTDAAVQELIAIITNATYVVVHLTTTSDDPRRGALIGIGLRVANSSYYVPVRHTVAGTSIHRPGQCSLPVLVSLLLAADGKFVAHDAKSMLRWLGFHLGIRVRFAWDTQVAAKLLRSDLPADLEAVAARELGETIPEVPAINQSDIGASPIEAVAEMIDIHVNVVDRIREGQQSWFH